MNKSKKPVKERTTVMMDIAVKEAARLAAKKEERTLSSWINLTVKRVLNVNTKETTESSQ